MVRWKASNEHHVASRLACLDLNLDCIAKRMTPPSPPMILFPQKANSSVLSRRA